MHLHTTLFIVLLVVATVICDEVPCSETNPCRGNFICHPDQGICYPSPPELGRPHMFLGCGHKSTDCDFFDFEYIGSYIIGRIESSRWCDTPSDVLCASRQEPALPKPAPANEFRFVAYNIWERNLWISMDGQRERTCRFPRQLALNWADVDAIAFQEVFMGGCWADQRASLRDLLSQHGFPYTTRTVRKRGRVVNGGIFIASRWPIIREDQHVFSNVRIGSWDMFAAKGVSYAQVEKKVDGVARTYHLMGTHLQAGGPTSIKLAQVKEWNSFMESLDIPSTDAVFFGGDFNVASGSDAMKEVLATLKAAVPNKTGDRNFTSDHVDNDLGRLSNPGSQKRNIIDYTLYSTAHRKPSEATYQIIAPRADEAFPVCWCETCPWLRRYVYPKEGKCKRVERVRDLGDHFPVLGTFVF